MSLSSIKTSAEPAAHQESVSASSSNPQTPVHDSPTYKGYILWLTWLQRLLAAHTLALFRCEYDRNQLHLTPMASVPARAIPVTFETLASRCASSCSTLRAQSNVSSEHSVVCVPEIVQANPPRARHVLLIQRQRETTFDPDTQTRLIAWAFQSLSYFLSAKKTDSANSSTVLSWSLDQLDSKETSASRYTRMMNTLLDATASERCVLARLSVKHGSVAGAALLAISGQPKIGKKLPSSEAMLFGIEQAFVNHPVPLKSVYEASVEPALPAMSSISSTRPRCSRVVMPVSLHQQWFAVSLERDATRPYKQAERKHLESDITAALVVALLSDPKALSLGAACKRRLRQLCTLARANVSRSAALCVALVLALAWLLYPVEHRVSAPLSVEAAERHVLIAPSDGFVKTVTAKAGDIVEKGKVLAALDDRDLQLEQQKLESEVLQNQQEYAKALASHTRVDITRLKEEAALLQTRLLQIEDKLGRMVLKAPVSGVVLSGSWDDFLGAAVAAGDTLFSLGSTHSHRLVLNVSEYDANAIRTGQAVGIRLSADPSRVLSATVTAIMPLTMASAGLNTVQVHAVPDQEMQLRPGMQGLGKVLVGRQSRLLQWLNRAGARLIWLAWKIGILK